MSAEGSADLLAGLRQRQDHERRARLRCVAQAAARLPSDFPD